MYILEGNISSQIINRFIDLIIRFTVKLKNSLFFPLETITRKEKVY